MRVSSTYWLIAANPNIYNHAEAFDKFGYIDWRQSAHFSVDDTIFIYCARPIKKIMFKCIVEKNDMAFEQITDDEEFWIDKDEYIKAVYGNYSRLRLVAQADNDFLTLESLQKNGLKRAPQGPMILRSTHLIEYIEKHCNDYIDQNLFPDIFDINENYSEGVTIPVLVNRYERSSVARTKCIYYHGTKCMICGFDFLRVYGDIGKGFIHVHHKKPISEISENYQINYKNDLIPVCPNCHAMLHRKIEDRAITIDELISLIKAKRIDN